MRLVRLSVLALLMIIVLGGSAMAQNTCATVDASRSTGDLVRVQTSFARPGDTVWMPIELTNDSNVTAFQFLIQYDTAWLTPLMLDETFLDYRIVSPRFLKLDTLQNSIGLDSIVDITQFSAVFFSEFFQLKQDVIATNFLPTETDPKTGAPRIDTLVPGSDRIFELGFLLDASVPHNTAIDFSMYTYEVIAFIDSSNPPPDTIWASACATAQMTTMGRDVRDSITMFQIYPQINYIGQKLIVDTAFVQVDPPVINSFTANPASVAPGGSSTLNWTVTNTDSVVVSFGTTRLFSSTSATSFAVTPPASDGQYSYGLVAWVGTQSVSASVNITVAIGGGGGTPPTMSLTPATNNYTLNQGETISFDITVSANPFVASEQVTLTVGALSNNMTFTPSSSVSGAGSVTGTFSFTPDFNQKGSYSISFTGVDADGVQAQTTVVFTVNEILNDRLFSTSAEGQKPVGGLPGAEGIYWPINLITSQTVYGIQFDLTYPYDMITIDSFVPTGRIPEWVVYDNIGQTPGQLRILSFGLANEPVQLDTTSAMLYAVLTIDSSAEAWTSETILIDNGRESVNPDPSVGSLPLVTDAGIVQVDKYGDVNLDRWIDVGDVVNIVASIIGNFTLTLRQFATADLIINDAIDVFDLIGVVNLIYGVEVSPSPGSPINTDPAVVNLAYSDLAPGSSDVMTITSELPEQIAGVQLEVAYDPGSVSLGTPALTADNDRFSLSFNDNGNGQMKILLYHLAPQNSDELLQIGTVDLVEVPILALEGLVADDKSKLRLTEVLLATSAAERVSVSGVDEQLPLSFELHQNYPNPFNPTTTVEFTVNASSGSLGEMDVRLDVFNVLGQRVITLADGPYSPGTHQVNWDATNDRGRRVATGIYLYRLIVGSEQKTKKMLFLK